MLAWYFWRWCSCSTMFLWIWHHFETESQLCTWFSFLFISGLPQSGKYDLFSLTPELWWRERGHILILAQRLQMTKFFSVQFAFQFPGTNFEYVQTIILIWFPCLLFQKKLIIWKASGKETYIINWRQCLLLYRTTIAIGWSSEIHK